MKKCENVIFILLGIFINGTPLSSQITYSGKGEVVAVRFLELKDTVNVEDFEKFVLEEFNSTFEGEYRQNHQRQIKELKELIARWDDADGNLILVTHYVIVGGALGYYPSSGELVITDKNLEVLDSIKTKY